MSAVVREAESETVGPVNPDSDKQCQSFGLTALEEGISSLPICEGLVNGKAAKVLRDSGCSSAGVREAYVNPEQLT